MPGEQQRKRFVVVRSPTFPGEQPMPPDRRWRVYDRMTGGIKPAGFPRRSLARTYVKGLNSQWERQVAAGRRPGQGEW